jgi:photosystem II stability/assembly factor-like uncharacterized protein
MALSRVFHNMKWLLFLIAILCVATSANGQHWTQLPNVKVQRTDGIPYFLNSTIGFYFQDDAVGGLTRTTDGGVNWTNIPFFDSLKAFIMQLCFVDKNHGYLATYAPDSTRGGVFETEDCGDHWRRITPIGRTTDGVYVAQKTVFVSCPPWLFVDNPLDNILFTRDDGATWDSITSVQGLTLDQAPHFEWIYGNRGNFAASIYYKNLQIPISNGMPWGETYLVYSTDLGLHWSAALLDSNYTWWGGVDLLVVSHSCDVFRQFLDAQDMASQLYPGSPDVCSFLKGSQNFTIWDSCLMHHETGNWVAGNACALYILNALGGNANYPYSDTAMYRSTDAGTSWSVIQAGSSGPSFTENDDYYRISPVAVVGYGAIVYACDYNGFLWKTTDGGDGSLSASALEPRLEFGHDVFATGNDTLLMSTCSPSSMIVYYQNLSCAITKLDSISITGIGPSEYSLTSTNHNDCLLLPDTTYVTLTPIKAGTYPITVNAHFVDDEYNTIDTALNFTMLVNSGGTSIPLGLYIKPTNITTQPGDTISIPVYLSGNATLGATSIALPFGIDTNVLQPIGFYPAISGITVGSITYSGGMGASSAMLAVPLQASGLTLSGETLIGTLRCIVYLADTLATSVTLAGASLTSTNSPCVALSLTTDSVSIAITGCGTATLLQFMKTGQIPLSIKSIVPNPAADEITVWVAAVGDHHAISVGDHHAISYQVIDVLGTVRAEGGRWWR